MAISQADYLKRCQAHVQASRKWREEEGYDKLWVRLINLYRGKHFETTSREDRIVVNIAFGTLNVIFPSISVNHPKITVNARDPEDYDRSVILETVVNYWWRHYDIKPHFRRAVKDYLTVGHGWIKTGYRFVEEEKERPQHEVEKEFGEKVAEVDDYAAANPHLSDSLPTDDELMASIPSTTQVVVEDRPYAERVSPFDMYVDPEAKDLSDAAWLAQRIIRPIEEVRSDSRYERSARKRVKPDVTVKKTWYRDQYVTDSTHKTDLERVTVWEYYNIKTNQMCVFAENGDEYLVKPQKMPYAFGQPFVMIRNYDVPDMFYPMGDLEAIEGLNLELDKLRSQAANARKRYARKFLARKEAFDAEGRRALTSDIDGEVAWVNDSVEALGEAIQPVAGSGETIPPEFFNQSSVIENDIDAVSGVSDFMRGSMPETRRTATEAAMIQDATNARAADKLAIIEASIGKVAENLVQLAQQYMTEESTVRIIGKNTGKPVWVPVQPEDIQGEYDFEVEGGSTQPQNETFRRQQALDLMNAAGPFIEMGVVDPASLFVHVLRDGFGIKDPERFLAQGPQPGGGAPSPFDPATPDPGTQSAAPPEEEQPPPGGTDAIPPELLAQLQGQVGAPVG